MIPPHATTKCSCATAKTWHSQINKLIFLNDEILFLPMKLTKNKKSDSKKYQGGYGKNNSLIFAGGRVKGIVGSNLV